MADIEYGQQGNTTNYQLHLKVKIHIFKKSYAYSIIYKITFWN